MKEELWGCQRVKNATPTINLKKALLRLGGGGGWLGGFLRAILPLGSLPRRLQLADLVMLKATGPNICSHTGTWKGLRPLREPSSQLLSHFFFFLTSQLLFNSLLFLLPPATFPGEYAQPKELFVFFRRPATLPPRSGACR